MHLSTLFPEVRLKRYIELRGADAGPMPMAVALGALWRGLLDDRDARTAAWELVAGRPFDEREALRREVPRGRRCRRRFGGHAAAASWRWSSCGSPTPAWRACRAARKIARCSRRSWGYATAGRTPADDLLDDYEAARGDPAKLVETLGAAAVGPSP